MNNSIMLITIGNILSYILHPMVILTFTFWVIIYHIEANDLEPNLQLAFSKQYSLMEKRLANIITTPGMILTVSMATGLLLIQPSWLLERWMQVKISFVIALLIYHFFCYRLMHQLEKGECLWSGQQLRALNELPTLLLVIIVMLVVFKSQFPTSAATWLIFGLVLFMALSIQFYARWRRLRNERLLENS